MSRTQTLAVIFIAAIAVITGCQPQSETSSHDLEPAGPVAEPVVSMENQHSAMLEPSATPEGTLAALYGDEVFFSLRNSIPSSALDHIGASITPDLREHFERHNESVAQWMAKNEGTGLKLPVSAGPIFLSNYEGADSFLIGEASIHGDSAEVNVSFSLNDVTGSLEWRNIALLKRVGDVWLLDGIQFESNEGVTYMLRDRVALVE